ncbi:sodium-dependent transporter [Thermoanaerobacteraceae bacterium SP2]|nr:sodium-dependent transporter [Thermoanaerobacteraceae bacterium SP2]
MENLERDQWKSRAGFIFSTVGAAVGLGNFWRFPFMAYKNGGGAFLIPYFFALLTAGVPLMIMEFSFGHRMKGGATLSFAKLGRKWEFIGWWQTMVPLIVMCYYSTIIAWSLNYLIFSFTQAWGADPNAFFGGKFLGVSSGPWDLGGFRWTIALGVIVVWLLNYFITKNGISGGIEKACRIMTPLLAVLMVIITIRGLTLPGATYGLNWFLKPDFSKIMDPQVWIAAYGQVFFSTTLAVGVMIAYASYLPEKSDIVNNSFITVFSNSSFDFLAGLAVFSILGYAAVASNVPFDKVAANGAGVAFVAFPKAISMLPMPKILQNIFGIMFFFSLFIAGISSSISMLESFATAALDKYDISREEIIKRISIGGFIGSMFIATGAGVHILDIVDHFVSSYGIALLGLIEAIVLGYVYGTGKIKEHANLYSDFKIGWWLDFCVKYLTPLMLGYMFIQNLINEFKAPYAGYPMSAIIGLGWTVAVGMLLVALYLSGRPWTNPHISLDRIEDRAVSK